MVVLSALAFVTLDASVITLRNGKTIRGEILVSNEEVVIIRDDSGARFQYPASEVTSVKETENTSAETPKSEEESHKPQGKKVTLQVDLTGGGAFIPQESNGGHIGGEFMIGSRYVGGRSIFIGGGIGVHGMFLGGKTYTFLPIQAAINVPIIEGKHAPFVGAAVGYGFGVSGGATGGIFTAAQVGYRYNINARSALLISLRAQFQEAKIDGTTVIVGEDGSESAFVSKSGRSFVTFGASMGITF